MTKIAIVEDEPGISEFISKGLLAAGYSVTTVSTGAEAIEIALNNDHALMILDIGLPDMDGFEVLHSIRGQGVQIPVIVLTARTSVEDTVSGLDSGADDYMHKPFRFDELLARIRLRLRHPKTTPVNSNTLITAGGIQLDLRTRRATVDGNPIELSAREFTMLQAFMEHREQVLSRTQLLDIIWGYDFNPGSNVVDVYVRYLRKKIGDDKIVTVRGMGYRLSIR